MSEKDLTFSIAKLDLHPGDVLVIKGPHKTDEQVWETNVMLGRIIPAGVRVLFIPPTVELSVLTKAEIEERISPSEVDRLIEEGQRLVKQI